MSRLLAPTKQDRARQIAREAVKQAAMQQSDSFRHFIESGDSNKASRLVSMAYLIFSVGNAYAEEANAIMEKHGFLHKRLKTKSTNLCSSFDTYVAEVEKLITDSGDYSSQQAHEQLCADFDIFQETCDRFMNADVRMGAMEAINRDDLRREAVYLCQVSDCSLAPVQTLKWNGDRWLEFVRTPFPKWTPTNQTVTHVIDRIKNPEQCSE